MKLFGRSVLLVALVTLLPGCLTQSLINHSKATNTDTLHPIALYHSTKNDAFAIEGTSSDNPSAPTYLIVPQPTWTAHNLKTNNTLSASQLTRLPIALTDTLEKKNHLPSSYEKIATLKTNTVQLPIEQSHPNRATLVFLPFAFAGDVLISPFELAILCAFMTNPGC